MKGGAQAAHHITTKAAAITTNKMKTATETTTGDMKATNGRQVSVLSDAPSANRLPSHSESHLVPLT